MAFTDPFIRRPVLASVISLLIVLLGIQAFNSLTIRQYPQMESALITVTTAYPGANAETIQGYITQPLQQSLASAEGVDYMTSVSQQNASVISVYARIGADTDRLYTELLSQANSVKNQLPQDAEDPVLNKQAADSTALMYISFYSDQLSNPQITDYLSRVIQPKLATLPGMAEAEILGNQVFAMRLWLDPVKLAAYGVSASDVNEAVRKYNFLSAAGEVKGQYVVTSINADTELKTPEAFAAIPLRTQGDSRVLLGDVARVEMGAESYNSISSFDGIPSVYIGIKGTPSANPLDVIKEVRAIMPQIEAQLPPGLKATIAYDATEFIQASIDEVVKTLAEAAVIVIVVVFLFLGSLRTVLIPVVTIPLSMIGVLFFMQAMGYSINLLTLLAMVLAIGLVVDDAIVVVENIHRHIEQGKSPFQAAIDGAREIAMPVVTMTITLAAVYAPIGFLQGLTGALFQEFALTLAGAVLISGVVALTLSPMMCSKLLRHEENPSGLAHRLDELFERLKQRYQHALHGTLNTRPVVLVFAVLVLALIPVLLMFTESELAPEEDQGIVFMMASAPKTANLDYLNAYTDQFLEIFKSFPEYYSWFQINGFDGVQSGIGGFLLKPWDERERSQMEILPEVQAKLDRLPGLQIFGFNLPSLPGTGEGLPFQFVINTANDYETLLQVTERIRKRAEESGKFAFLDVDLAFDKPEIVVEIDREKAGADGRLHGRPRPDPEHPARRRRDQPVHHRRPQLQGHRPGRARLPRQPGLAEQLLRAQWARRDAAAVDADPGARSRPTDSAQAVPATQRRDDPGLSDRQHGRGDRNAADHRPRRSARRFQLRLRRRLAPVHPGRQRAVPDFRAGIGGDLPGPGRAVRELPRSSGDPGHRAAVGLWRAGAAVPWPVEHEHLYPGGSGDADRLDQQAWHHDRRVRQSAAPRTGPESTRSGGRSGGDSPAAGADDHSGDGVRHGAADHRQWGRRGQPVRHRPGDCHRHVGGYAVHPVRATGGL